MTGDYVPEEIFSSIIGDSITNTKSRLGSIPGRLSNQLVHADKATATRLLDEAFQEALDEVKLYDAAEYRNRTEGFIMTLTENDEGDAE